MLANSEHRQKFVFLSYAMLGVIFIVMLHHTGIVNTPEQGPCHWCSSVLLCGPNNFHRNATGILDTFNDSISIKIYMMPQLGARGSLDLLQKHKLLGIQRYLSLVPKEKKTSQHVLSATQLLRPSSGS